MKFVILAINKFILLILISCIGMSFFGAEHLWAAAKEKKCAPGLVRVKKNNKWICQKVVPKKHATVAPVKKPKEVVSCPADMVLVQKDKAKVRLCVDKYEYTLPLKNKSIESRQPVGYQSQITCQALCRKEGKRLLTNSEWLVACEGTVSSNCNIKRGHPLMRKLNGKNKWVYNGINCKQKSTMWSVPCMNDPDINRMSQGLAANKEFPKCVSKYGVYNMVGNLGEWVAGAWINKKRERVGRFNGGLYPQTLSSCIYSTIAHGPNYKDYSIGCRCGKNVGNK